MLRSQQEKTISGFLVGPPKEPRGSREPRKDHSDYHQNRASYSGPLVPGYGLGKAPKELDHSSTISTRSNLSTVSSLVASRNGDGNQENSGPSVSNAVNKFSRFSGPIHGMEPLMRRQDSKYHSRRNADICPIEDGKIRAKGSTLVSFCLASSLIFTLITG